MLSTGSARAHDERAHETASRRAALTSTRAPRHWTLAPNLNVCRFQIFARCRRVYTKETPGPLLPITLPAPAEGHAFHCAGPSRDQLACAPTLSRGRPHPPLSRPLPLRPPIPSPAAVHAATRTMRAEARPAETDVRLSSHRPQSSRCPSRASNDASPQLNRAATRAKMPPSRRRLSPGSPRRPSDRPLCVCVTLLTGPLLVSPSDGWQPRGARSVRESL